jgi:hypothetical protein
MALTRKQSYILSWRSWCFGISASLIVHGTLLAWLLHSSASFGSLQSATVVAPSAVSGDSSALTVVTVLPAETHTDHQIHVARTMPPLPRGISADLLALPDISIDSPVAASPAAGTKIAQCEVHIHQKAHGELEAFDFGDCSGDTEWQRTLQLALEQAATLIDSSGDKAFPAVRTIVFRGDSLSVLAIANTLSTPESH